MSNQQDQSRIYTDILFGDTWPDQDWDGTGLSLLTFGAILMGATIAHPTFAIPAVVLIGAATIRATEMSHHAE